MIRRLRRKFILIVMAVVTLILLAIFFTMLLTTQRNNERLSLSIMHQALNTRGFAVDSRAPLPSGDRPSPDWPEDALPPPADRLSPAPNMRLPVLVAELSADDSVVILSNKLHFLADEDVAPLVALVLDKGAPSGVLQSHALRFLREDTPAGTYIAFADIFVEQEMLRTQVTISLLIGTAALLAFFLLSLLLARWAVRPVEVAWEQQKQFVANASHELKTPLTVIFSNAEMLRTDDPANPNASRTDATTADNPAAANDAAHAKNARRIEHIHAEALRMKHLVENMLTLAQSDSAVHMHASIRSAVDFSDLLHNAALMYESLAYDNGKRLHCDITDSLTVAGDAARLQQVLHILLDNALKYTSAGGAIRISLHKTERHSLLLVITNDGTPLPKAALSRIFLRFYRQDESRSYHSSFGLGLAIAQSITHEHKGRIWAETDGQTSNRFCVTLPLRH